MRLSINKKTLGWACIALFFLLSCGRRDILTDPATTPTQQTPTESGQDSDTPLHQAILAQADLASLYPFLQPTFINQIDKEGNTPLHRAVIQDNLPLVGLLLSAKATIDAQNAEGLTPLHLAAKQGNLLTLHLLLIYQADIHAKDKEGHTPLDYINEQQHTDQLQQLLQRTPWDSLTIERDPFVVAWLLAAEKTRTKATQGWTPLHLAACLGQMEAIQDLIANKADIEAKNSNGWTPLHLAAFLGQPEAIQALLDNKAATEAKDNQGYTPLHVATLAGRLEAVQLLINHQAPVDAIDHKGRTPYDIAESAAVKKLLGSRMNLGKLVFNCDYDNIGKRVVSHLTAREQGQLRQTCTEMGWNLLQKGDFHLQVTPDKLPHLQSYLYPRLYPHTTTSHCVCPTFEPIPADAMVRGVADLEQIAKNKHLLIKNVVFKGGIATLETLRAALPTHLIEHLIVPAEILAKEEARLARKKAAAAAQEATFSSANPIVEEESTPLGEEEEPTPSEVEEPSENFYKVAENDYGFTSQPADQIQYVEEDREASSVEEYEFSDDGENPQADPAEDTEQQELKTVDPGNRLYNSFVGVKKLPAGKVTIEDYLAEGAFGQVFRGQWRDRLVALKQIDLQHAVNKLKGEVNREEVKEAMQWEVARLSTANHPNLVQFYGLYQDRNEGYSYMVMEFCERGTLQGALEKKYVPWSQRWQWALQISQALAYLHQEGVLHRDLKAENILLDKQGRAKLADLGVAQVDALLQETEASVVAKGAQDKRFIAPEVEANQTLSTKETDIYALGLVFWQIATGKEPKKIDNLNSYRQDDWREGREREAIPDDCPESFKALILECWTKEPTQRPTAQGVLAKLAALGPELDPYHHLLVTAAQKLELIVHPKRKEGRAYLPPFVTHYSVDESIETYWNRIEAAQAKTEAVKAKEGVNANPPLTLAETFREFIETPNANTLLLLGEAGLGKTLTTYQWGDQLLDQWWAHMNTGTPAPAYFPLFIRPELPTWSHAGIKGAFQEVARKYNLPKGIQPLVFIDGYDELQLDADPMNLVEHLELLALGHPKLIVTCRPRTVEQSTQGARFGFNGALTTRHFLPFSLDQLLDYLQKELSWEEKVCQDYKNTLGSAESVRTVLRNPFVLQLFKQSWETLSKRPLDQLNRWQIYEGFMEHILQANKTLLSTGVQKILQGGHPDLLSSYQAFVSEVAWQSFQQKDITLGWEKAKVISPWTQVKQYAQEDAKDEFVKRQAQLTQGAEERKAQQGRRSLLNEDDYVHLTQKKVGQAEGELPLQLRGEGSEQRYEYTHKSLFEYGMAKRLLLLRNSPNIVEEGIKLLNNRKIQEEPEALQFWQEGWKVPSSEGMTAGKAFIEPLFALITESRDDETIQQASANSATLLAQAQVAFSGRALQGVRLPGADLSGALLSHTCLEGAQLPGTILREAYLGNADLRGANLSDVSFGQYPSLKCKSQVYCLGYHPAGTQLAVGLEDGNIELYDQAEGTYTPVATLKGRRGIVMSLTYRRDGQQLASGSGDGIVGLWDVESKQLITQLKGHSGSVMSVTYRRDGQQLASGSLDNTVGLWGVESKQLITQLKGHSGSVMSVTYRRDGQQLASGSLDNTVGLWDVESKQLITQLKGHSGSVMSVTYRRDGQQLASGSLDNTVGLWDVESKQLITQLKGHSSSVMSVTYRRDGQQLASGSFDKTVGLWDVQSKQLITLLKGHSGGVMSVTYRRDGQQLASGSFDKTVGLWDVESKQLITQLKDHSGSVRSVTYRRDGQQLASGSEDKTVGLWNVESKQLITLLKGHSGSVISVTYRRDGQQLASGSEDNTVGLWDVESKQLITLLKGHSDSVMSVTYRRDGQQLASVSEDNTVGLWDPQGHQLLALLKGHRGQVNSVCYRPDGQQLASGSSDNTVGLWDPKGHQLQALLGGHSGWVNSVCYRRDGQQLASGSYDNTVGLWDVESKQLITLLKGHSDSVMSVTYRRDGQQLASGSLDNTVGLWDVESKQLITLLKGHSGSVRSVTYRRDGQQLASGSDDGAIFVWARQDTAGSLQETWQLIHRFENTHSLSASGTLLKGATISEGNRTLLKQKGAYVDSNSDDNDSDNNSGDNDGSDNNSDEDDSNDDGNDDDNASNYDDDDSFANKD